jgi:hypothetical protein
MRELAWGAFAKNAETVDKRLAFLIAERMIRHGPLHKSEFQEACGSIVVGDRFLSNNVFSVRSDGLYGFEDKITEDVVRDRLKNF